MSATASNAAYRNTSARVAATYATDGLNRLTSTTGTTLVYDALDRLNQVVSGAGTKFLYEGQQIIAEYNGAGTLQRRYVPGPGLDNPYVWFEGTGTASNTARWLLGNAFGSIIAVGSTGAANTTLAINSYDEFGVGPTSNLGRFQYKGMTYIPEVGLYHARARTYSQYLGRFMQPDPSGYSDGMNLYAFVHNGPINGRDVLGLYGENPDCIRGPNHNECPGMQVTSTPPSMDPASAPIHIDWPALSVPTLAGGGGGTGGKSAPQSQTPTRCLKGSVAGGGRDANQQSHIRTGAAVGFSAFAIIGAIVVLNIVGFPEVEAVEVVGGTAAAGGGAAAMTADSGFGVFLETISEPASSMAVGAANAGVYGTIVGGAVGAAIPSSGCP